MNVTNDTSRTKRNERNVTSRHEPHHQACACSSVLGYWCVTRGCEVGAGDRRAGRRTLPWPTAVARVSRPRLPSSRGPRVRCGVAACGGWNIHGLLKIKNGGPPADLLINQGVRENVSGHTTRAPPGRVRTDHQTVPALCHGHVWFGRGRGGGDCGFIIHRPAAARARSWRRLRRGDGCPAAVAPGH